MKALKILRLIRYYISTFFSTKLFIVEMKILKNKVGNNAQIDGNVIIKSARTKSISIGNNFKLNSRVRSNLVGITNPAIIQILDNGKLKIGNNCGFTSLVISSREDIIIGDNVKIGANVRIFDHDYHSLNFLDRRDKKLDGNNCKSKKVTIGDDVFIGTNSIILKGVTIGDRTIIGAGAVVSNQNIPSDSLVVGNPAQIIKRK